MWKQIKNLGIKIFLPRILEKIFLGLEDRDVMTLALNEAAKYKPLQNAKNWHAFISCVIRLMDDWKEEAKREYHRFDFRKDV